MSKDALLGVARGARQTPQTEKADPRQVMNAAGGYVFKIDAEAQLRRFITIGTASGTYYASARELTEKNADTLMDMAGDPAAGLRMVEIIREMSVAGRAAKADYGIFALAVAVAFGDPVVQAAAYKASTDILRTGTHLFTFLRYVKLFRGLGGNGMKRALERWYSVRPVDKLGTQLVKYRQRAGFTHRDVLRIAHPNPGADESRDALYNWVVKPENHIEDVIKLPGAVRGYLLAQEATEPKEWARLVRDFNLTWEMLPDAAMNSPLVWEAFLDAGIGQTALIRQLPRLTKIGIARKHGARIAEQLRDPEKLRAGRVHPFNVLVALKTYQSGQGFRSRGEGWTPERVIVDALDDAFYAAFKGLEPSGKKHLIAIDVSGSMGATVMDSPLSAREAAVAMAMSIARVEPDWKLVAFTSGAATSWRSKSTRGSLQRGYWNRDNDGLTELTISPRQRLDDIVRETSGLPFGATDVALPVLWAQDRGESFDVISTWSDQESWQGSVHPYQALREYRKTVNPQARMVAVGMTATDYTVAEPGDPLSLDVSGMDSSVPNLVAGFARGEF
jgi:60 kDa SS-A/Ro ribonucleoprotein